MALPELIQMTLDRNPRLSQAAFAIDVARGRALQAGLYPNPTVSITGDELGDRTGPPGIWTAPLVSQEIVTGHKLGLSRSAVNREVDQATLALVAERFDRFTALRQSYFEVLTLQRRLGILNDLARLPVPLWNRNQGNIAAAQAQVGQAIQQGGRVENELTERLAVAFGGYASARQRAERFRTAILPKARETYKLSLEAYKGGQFQYLRVLEAQRTVAQADLEYNRALGEVWRAASEIAGLLLEEDWPACAVSLPPEPKHLKE